MIRGFLLPLLLLALWQIITEVPEILGVPLGVLVVAPPPIEVIQQFLLLLRSPSVIVALGFTLGHATLGLSLGLVLALGVGSFLGVSRTFSTYLTPSLHALRAIPVVLFIPIAVLLLGADAGLAISLSALISFLYSFLPVARAVRDYDEEKLIFLRSRDVNTLSVIVSFLIPEITAAISTSIRIAVTLSLSVVVVSEMLFPALGGLGAGIIAAKEASRYLDLWALTFLMALAGYFFQYLIIRMWKFSFPWAHLEEV